MPDQLNAPVSIIGPEEIPTEENVEFDNNDILTIKKSHPMSFPTGPLPVGADEPLIRRFFARTMVKRFPTNNELFEPYEICRCGQSALSYLSGLSIPAILRILPSKTITDEEALHFLSARGFVVQPLLGSLVQSSFGYINTHITSAHVVLMRVVAGKEETTWIVVWGNRWIHNLKGTKMTGTTLINMPPVSQYLVFHPTRWRRAKSSVDYNRMSDAVAIRDGYPIMDDSFDADEDEIS